MSTLTLEERIAWAKHQPYLEPVLKAAEQAKQSDDFLERIATWKGDQAARATHPERLAEAISPQERAFLERVKRWI